MTSSEHHPYSSLPTYRHKAQLPLQRNDTTVDDLSQTSHPRGLVCDLLPTSQHGPAGMLRKITEIRAILTCLDGLSCRQQVRSKSCLIIVMKSWPDTTRHEITPVTTQLRNFPITNVTGEVAVMELGPNYTLNLQLLSAARMCYCSALAHRDRANAIGITTVLKQLSTRRL